MNCVSRCCGRALQGSVVLSSREQAEGWPARWFEPRETQDLCACADTRRGRGGSCAFMRRTRRMAENGAGVELRRAVRGHLIILMKQRTYRRFPPAKPGHTVIYLVMEAHSGKPALSRRSQTVLPGGDLPRLPRTYFPRTISPAALQPASHPPGSGRDRFRRMFIRKQTLRPVSPA
jgi:hypothetical protein